LEAPRRLLGFPGLTRESGPRIPAAAPLPSPAVSAARGGARRVPLVARRRVLRVLVAGHVVLRLFAVVLAALTAFNAVFARLVEG
jgi:hypothetical protein